MEINRHFGKTSITHIDTHHHQHQYLQSQHYHTSISSSRLRAHSSYRVVEGHDVGVGIVGGEVECDVGGVSTVGRGWWRGRVWHGRWLNCWARLAARSSGRRRRRDCGKKMCMRGGTASARRLKFPKVKIIAADQIDTRCHYLVPHGPILMAACGARGTRPIRTY
jgi:hypothetical protein